MSFTTIILLFFLDDAAINEIYTLSLHDALPICPNVFEMAATETITSIILIKLIRVSLGTVRHPRRFKIVDARYGFRSEERFSRNAETDLVCRLLLEKKKKKP